MCGAAAAQRELCEKTRSFFVYTNVRVFLLRISFLIFSRLDDVCTVLVCFLVDRLQRLKAVNTGYVCVFFEGAIVRRDECVYSVVKEDRDEWAILFVVVDDVANVLRYLM